MQNACLARNRTAPDGRHRPHRVRPCRRLGGSGQRALPHRYTGAAVDWPHAWQRLVCPLYRSVSARSSALGRPAAKWSDATGSGVMSVGARLLCFGFAAVYPATIVAAATSTIILAICATNELWCRSLGASYWE